MRLGAAVAWLSVAAGCGSTALAPSPPLASLGSPHFVVRHAASDAAIVPAMTAALEDSYARILSNLRATGMPIVTLTLYSDHAALEAATRAIAGVVPPWTAGLVTSESQIHMMSPSIAGWGPLDRMVVNLVHEFAHCVSLHVNPRIANHPRWLWESVAIYEAGQRVDLRTIPYMTALAPPSFAALDDVEDTRVYDVGYSIGEFLVARWGQDALAGLVASGGDTAAALGAAPADVERAWFAFARDRYGF